MSEGMHPDDSAFHYWTDDNNGPSERAETIAELLYKISDVYRVDWMDKCDGIHVFTESPESAESLAEEITHATHDGSNFDTFQIYL